MFISGETWVQLTEKAYATFHGAYEYVQGTPQRAFEQMTGGFAIKQCISGRFHGHAKLADTVNEIGREKLKTFFKQKLEGKRRAFLNQNQNPCFRRNLYFRNW